MDEMSVRGTASRGERTPQYDEEVAGTRKPTDRHFAEVSLLIILKKRLWNETRSLLNTL